MLEFITQSFQTKKLKEMKKYLLLLALVCLLGNRALAQTKSASNTSFTHEVIDFTQLQAVGGLNGSSWDGNYLVSVNGGTTIGSLSSSRRISVSNTDGWNIWTSDQNQCSYFQKAVYDVREVYINNLNVGDIVRIWCQGQCYILTDNTATQDGSNPLVWNHNDPNPDSRDSYPTNSDSYPGVQLKETLYRTGSDENGWTVIDQNPDGNELRIVNDHNNGTLVIRLASQWAGILKVEIDAVNTTAHYDYDPGFEVYDMFETRNDAGNTGYNANESAGFKLNNNDAYYLKFTNNDLSLNERIAVSPANGWGFARGMQAPNYSLNNNDWSNFSICNLREGDRVVIYYTGDAPIFSSNGKDGDYTGSAAYKDTWNDGMLDTSEGDHIISKGDPVEYSYCRDEGNIARDESTSHVWIYTSYPYVMMENGHLDLALKNGNRTRIVKIKIYSDHQAMMVDDYNTDHTYTSYFNITGELQAKQHIVPGGLEVHVGSDNADQHANVVFSKEGPVSYVKAVDGYKLPGTTKVNGEIQRNFNLANEAPETGTYYTFIPETNGKMTVKFKAISLNYYRWDLPGDAIYYDDRGWILEFDRANEWPLNRTCPYYLKVQDDNQYYQPSNIKVSYDDGANFSTLNSDLWINNGEYCIITLDVEAGKTYYLYGAWSGNNYQLDDPRNSNTSGKDACGVAELLWVNFSPDNYIFPLAKWVPNGTMAVNASNPVPNPDTFADETELATVKGYDNNNITVKKMSGNITACHPYIEYAEGSTEGKLMIDGITFADDKNKGGTILIKIGDSSVKTDPVYALTIAYSAAEEHDKDNADGSRGHTWDFSTNSLRGLEWASPYTANSAQPRDYGTYFKNYFGDFNNTYTSADDVLTKLEKTTTNSLLYQEMTNPDGSDWLFYYNLVYGGKLYDPVFTNKYDMEGDNADMIWDTEGTVLQTSANQSCIFNEFGSGDIHSSTKDPDRYVGFFEGGKFRIPWLMKNDRVIIYMGTGTGRYADEVKFKIKHAYDALHNEISENDEYIVGGSHWDGADGDPYYRGCYHFFATGNPNDATKPADMVFEMTSGSMCKIYNVQIYRGDRIITNDLVPVGDSPLYLVSKKGSDEEANGTYSIQYLGKGESVGEPEMAGKTGNLANATYTLAALDDDKTTVRFTTTANDKFGVFNMRLDDLERNNKYVADFADRNFPIGYYEEMQHPYTWDFTDVNRFNTSYLASENTKYGADDLNIWDAEKNFTWKRDDTDDLLFAPGGQIYADAQMIAESAGMRFTPMNVGSGTIQVTAEGLRIEGGDLNENDINALTTPNVAGGSYAIGSDEQKSIWEDPDGSSERKGWKLTIPNLPNLTAAYIRVQTIEDKDPKLTFNFSRGSGTEDNWSFFKKTIDNGDGTKDIIVGISPSLGGSDMPYDIFLNNVIVKKIATSKDIKPAFGKTGYQTESRHREIDHRLTGFFTDEDIEAFYGTLGTNDNGEKVVKLHHLNILDRADPSYTGDGIGTGEENKPDWKNSPDMEGKGCILYHKNGVEVTDSKGNKQIDRSFSILDGGFHLFVPDMHDMDKTTGEDDLGGPDDITSENILWARYYNADVWSWGTRVAQGLAEMSGNDINYALSASHYNRSDEIEKGNGYDVGFYHVASKGASTPTHSAYIRMSSGNVSQSKIFFAFADDFFEENHGITTQIDDASHLIDNGQLTTDHADWYNLNGQKLSGMPSANGLYIKNGKKVIIK